MDLLALFVIFGVLSCRLWVLPRGTVIADREPNSAAWPALKRLLGWSLALISVTSFLVLTARSMQMSRQPLSAMPSVLPTVLLQTHYGSVWLMRTGALAVLWLGWWSLQRTGRTYVPALMFCMAAVIAWSYSATGHAADWGDFTWTEWMHWLHILNASLWTGSMLAAALALSSLLVPRTPEHKTFIAETMHRLSYISTFAVIGVLVTGAFNATMQMASVQALWETDYGRMLAIKLSIVLTVIILWMLNRFAVVPMLRAWLSAFRMPDETRTAPARPPGIGQGGIGKRMQWHRWLMVVDAVLLVAVLLCAVLLAFNMPPRQHAAMQHTPAGGKLILKK
jgi:putative copper export protein